MSSPVQKGDVISFALDAKREITVNWSQSFSSRSEPYYAIFAKNTSRGNFFSLFWYSFRVLKSLLGDAAVNFFVQKDWLDNKLSSFASIDGKHCC